jgi:hypothetical protein
MLTADEQMRWWGMDMRSRRRRRWAISGFYVLLFAVLVGIGTTSRWTAHPYAVLLSMIAMGGVLGRLSIFGKNGPLKDRDRPYVQLGKMEYVRVTGLDERARYRFGVENFESASEAQKDELLNTNKVGTYWMLKDRDHTPWLDERELRERDNAERWALKEIIIILGSLTGIWFSQMADHGKLDGYSVVTLLLFVVLLAMTLPKARVLWTEPDPRELSGEIHMVDGAGCELSE